MHELLTIDRHPRALHPVEVILVNAALLHDRHVRRCRCGWIIVGNNDVDVHAMYSEHLRAAERARQRLRGRP